jgi:hypothetical protein
MSLKFYRKADRRIIGKNNILNIPPRNNERVVYCILLVINISRGWMWKKMV